MAKILESSQICWSYKKIYGGENATVKEFHIKANLINEADVGVCRVPSVRRITWWKIIKRKTEEENSSQNVDFVFVFFFLKIVNNFTIVSHAYTSVARRTMTECVTTIIIMTIIVIIITLCTSRYTTTRITRNIAPTCTTYPLFR
jgi:hypothetical protein